MTTKPVQPNFDWYSSLSLQNGVQPRCPFSNVEMCPRYYESLSLLGVAGITTPLQQSEEKRLLAKWKRSEHWPKLDEHRVSILDGRHFMHFCPEVAYDFFGLFASGLYRYSDEEDCHRVHEQLSENGTSTSDWRWQWSNIIPLHYSECQLYSTLIQTGSKNTQEAGRKEIVEVKPSMFGIKIDVKETLIRFWKWICFKRKV